MLRALTIAAVLQQHGCYLPTRAVQGRYRCSRPCVTEHTQLVCALVDMLPLGFVTCPVLSW
jgi:hypothetical protein